MEGRGPDGPSGLTWGDDPGTGEGVLILVEGGGPLPSRDPESGQADTPRPRTEGKRPGAKQINILPLRPTSSRRVMGVAVQNLDFSDRP